jgi:uncharacterized protein involved in outer membrane biogenesis
MKIIKITIALLMLLAVVCGLAIASLIYFIDPNQIKPALIEEVKKKTGYVLGFEGAFTWSFYPRVAIHIPHLLLRKNAQSAAFLDVREVKMAAELSQLWQGIKKLEGHLDIASLTFMQVHLESIHMDIHWREGILSLMPIRASLYGGSVESVMYGRQFSSTPSWDGSVQFKQVALRPLLKDALGQEAQLFVSGLVNSNLQVTTSGRTQTNLIKHLNGQFEFAVEQGVLEGIDINYLLQTAKALINKQELSLSDTHQTPFSHFAGSALIKNGVALSRNIELNTVSFNAKALGEFHLADQSLDFQLRVKPAADLQIKALPNLEIPMLVSGSVRHPEVRLDVFSLQQDLLKQKVKVEIQELKQKANEQIKAHIPGKAGEFLQKLIN